MIRPSIKLKPILIMVLVISVAGATIYIGAYNYATRKANDAHAYETKFYGMYYQVIVNKINAAAHRYQNKLVADKENLRNANDNSNKYTAALHTIGDALGTHQNHLAELTDKIMQDSTRLDSCQKELLTLKALRP